MQTIKVVAIIETEEDTVFDDLAMENSVGLLGTIKSYDIDYNIIEEDPPHIKAWRRNEDKKED